MNILDLENEIIRLDYLLERNRVHQDPLFQELKTHTSLLILEELQKMGYQIHTNIQRLF